MTEHEVQVDVHFMQLVLSLQAAAMQQMGKVASPISGQIERDLQMASNSIDMLSMIETKSKGNLSTEEATLIGHVLYELRLNYVDELKKGDTQDESKAETPGSDEPPKDNE